MIEKLFALNNIKYIISVDDCFYMPNLSSIKATLYSSMTGSIAPFKELLANEGHSVFIKDIEDLNESGEDVSGLVSDLLDELDEPLVLKCFELCDDKTLYSQEKELILGFLKEQKDKGLIDEYRTFSSTGEANQFDCCKEGMDKGSILWLIDVNFDRVDESEEEGYSLAKNIVARESPYPSFVYCLTARDISKGVDEDQIEADFDSTLASICEPETRSLIYYMNKTRLQTKDTNKIAQSLAQGFKRKACFEIINLYKKCLEEGVSKAIEKTCMIRQDTLNYLFSHQTLPKDEPFIEVAERLVNIFVQEEYRKCIESDYGILSEKAKQYEKLCKDIQYPTANAKRPTTILKEYRNLEMYNMHINALHSEIQQGDIFEINSSFYLLITQSCDTCLRNDGNRKLDYALLLKIKDNNQETNKYPLSSFKEMRAPSVSLTDVKYYPFQVLDLCVLNDEGQASIIIDSLDRNLGASISYRDSYYNRFIKVYKEFAEIVKNQRILDSYLGKRGESTLEETTKAVEVLTKTVPEMKNYSKSDETITFPVRRVTRLSERFVIDVVNKYSSVISRIGHPFDFTTADNNSN